MNVRNVVVILLALVIVLLSAYSAFFILPGYSQEDRFKRAAFNLGAVYALKVREDNLCKECTTYGEIAEYAWEMCEAED